MTPANIRLHDDVAPELLNWAKSYLKVQSMLGATRAYSGLFYSCLLCTVFLRVITRAVKKDTGGIINHFMRLMNDNFCSYVVWKHLFPVIFMALFTSSVLILLHISHTSHYYLGCTKVSINVESFLLLLVCPSVVQF